MKCESTSDVVELGRIVADRMGPSQLAPPPQAAGLAADRLPRRPHNDCIGRGLGQPFDVAFGPAKFVQVGRDRRSDEFGTLLNKFRQPYTAFCEYSAVKGVSRVRCRLDW